jgi:hypothetical protein
MVKFFELSMSCRSYRNASHCLTLDVQDNENKNTGKVIYLVSMEPNRTIHSKGSWVLYVSGLSSLTLR